MEFLGLRFANPISIESVTTEAIHEAINGQKYSVRKPYQYWRFRIRLEPSAHQRESSVWGQIIAHRAQHQQGGTFSMFVPQPHLCELEYANIQDFTGSRLVGSDNEFTVHDSAAVLSDCIQVGRLIHAIPSGVSGAGIRTTPGKIHMITSVGRQTIADGGFVKEEVSFYPPINRTGTSISPVRINAWRPVGEFRYAETGNNSVTIGNRGIIDHTITVEEAL